MYDVLPSQRDAVKERVKDLVDQRLPKLFRQDETCGLSLLELEARSLKSKPTELAKRYLARSDWPLNGAFLHMYWTIAEQVNDVGVSAAREMWGVIRDKGAPNSPEVQFSKARLDPTRTEFEKLWD
jgi:hypothetical protein